MRIKKLGVLIIALLFGFQLSTSAKSFEVGQHNLGLGMGFGTVWINGYGYSSTLPPVSVDYEIGIRDDIGPGIISVGGYFGVSGYKYRYSFANYGYNYTSIMLLGRSAYHYEFVENLDTYAGFSLGFRINTSKEYGDFPTTGSAYEDTQAGVRFVGDLYTGAKYYFTPTFAAFAELGYGNSIFRLGVNFKLK